MIIVHTTTVPPYGGCRAQTLQGDKGRSGSLDPLLMTLLPSFKLSVAALFRSLDANFEQK